jgi:hypothetical protein
MLWDSLDPRHQNSCFKIFQDNNIINPHRHNGYNFQVHKRR